MRKKEAHLKCFASECVDVVFVLNLFIDLVVSKSEIPAAFARHVECMQLLADIAKILAKPEDILQNVNALEDKLCRHQQLYSPLYKTIPKNHFARQLTDCIRVHKVFMTCWAPERDHSNSKRVARACFKKCEKTLLDRMNYHFFRDLVESPNILQETYLIDPTPCSAFDCYLQAGAVVAASRKANCKLGEINTGTYIWVVDVPTMEPKLCTVVFFLILICLVRQMRTYASFARHWCTVAIISGLHSMDGPWLSPCPPCLVEPLST